MAYFQDLTPYAYLVNQYTEQPDALNVGWLEYPHEFPKGDVAPEALARLAELCVRPVNLCRGSHRCNFCHQAQGNGEIRVQGDGVVYAAPVLIVHYVLAHGYRPPGEFIAALI